MSNDPRPHSAIPSWSGFIYQGKVALYHALKLINENKYSCKFEVQLDSTDDFAIYLENIAISAHQVKAKSSHYRSEYEEALSNSSIIEHDRTTLTKRYFHTAINIDNSSDHNDANGVTVKFYRYDDQPYCPLMCIDEKSKALLKLILDNKSIAYSTKIINHNYSLLSEHISKKVIHIHAINQSHGKTIRDAAYENRISCKSLLDIATNIAIENDTEYAIAKLRDSFSSTLEVHVIENLDQYSDQEIKRLRATFEYLYNLDNFQMEKLCNLIQPSETLPVLPYRDVEAYADLICEFFIDPTLSGIPHYLNTNKDFYLPTAIELPNPKRAKTFETRLIKAIQENNKLPTLLYEYKNLIAAQCEKSIEVSILPTTIGTLPSDDPRLIQTSNTDYNIVRKLQVNIISKPKRKRNSMLNNILGDAVKSNNFKTIELRENIQIFERVEGEAKRFIILYEATTIQNVDELNELIINNIPEQLKEEPAFNKNTDLIVIHKLENLSEFKRLENEILAIEEDPYHFKKYVLYYIDGEEALLDKKTYEDLKLIISNQPLFESYKSAPLIPSAYSIAARIFIKLPFLDLPKKSIDLTPLNLQAQELIAELGHTELDKLVQSTALNDGQIDRLIQELINNEMENL